MNYFEVMALPYVVFLSYLKWTKIFKLEETEEGRKILYKEDAIYKTEPELNRLRQLQGYRKA